MKKLTTTLLSVLSLFAVSAFAEMPPQTSIEKVQAIITQMAEDPESDQLDEALKEELSIIVESYGVEGLAAVSLQEPVLMESFMISPELGYGGLSKSLLSQAKSVDELKDMLAALAASQVAIGQNPSSKATFAFIENAVALSSLDVSPEDLEKMVDVASIEAMETSDDEVAAASRYDRQRLRNLKRLRRRLVRIFGEMSFVVELIDHVISRVQSRL